jgi:hypothetical protein
LVSAIISFSVIVGSFSIYLYLSDIWFSGKILLNAALKIHPLNSLLDSSQKTPENFKI